MGILNITPDSFYQGSRIKASDSEFGERVEKMVDDGADILDIGGYSTRPGAKDISESEEIERVVPSIKWVKKNFPDSIISIDTFRSSVAKAAVETGAQIVNDISAGELDPNMALTVANLGTPYIAMHMRGTPQDMQTKTDYKDLIPEILRYFSSKLDEFKNLGINDVIIDAGFGFAKSLEQNYEILRRLSEFGSLNRPLLVGISRKSMIYRFLNSTPEQALNGTTALNMIALSKGANLLRVHDVKEAKETIDLYKKLYP